MDETKYWGKSLDWFQILAKHFFKASGSDSIISIHSDIAKFVFQVEPLILAEWQIRLIKNVLSLASVWFSLMH